MAARTYHFESRVIDVRVEGDRAVLLVDGKPAADAGPNAVLEGCAVIAPKTCPASLVYDDGACDLLIWMGGGLYVWVPYRGRLAWFETNGRELVGEFWAPLDEDNYSTPYAITPEGTYFLDDMTFFPHSTCPTPHTLEARSQHHLIRHGCYDVDGQVEWAGRTPIRSHGPLSELDLSEPDDDQSRPEPERVGPAAAGPGAPTAARAELADELDTLLAEL